MVIRSVLVPDGPIEEGYVDYREGFSDEEVARMCSYLLGYTFSTDIVERIRQEFCGVLESEWRLKNVKRRSPRRKEPIPTAPVPTLPAEATIKGLSAKIRKKAAMLEALSKHLDAFELQSPAVQSGSEGGDSGRALPLIEGSGPEENVENRVRGDDG